MGKILIILAFGFLCACTKDEISKGSAKAKPSFSSEWDFKAEFSFEDDIYSIRLDYYNDSTGLINRIGFSNIPNIEDTVKMSYVSEVPWIVEKFPTARFSVMDDDVQGELYVTDSSNVLQSYIIIDCATRSKISGKFRINFMLSSRSILPKLSPNIPDYFIVDEGNFNAEKL